MKANISRSLILALVITTIATGCGNANTTKGEASDTQYTHTEGSELETEEILDSNKNDVVTDDIENSENTEIIENTEISGDTESTENSSPSGDDSQSNNKPSQGNTSSNDNLNSESSDPSFSESKEPEKQESASGEVFGDPNSDRIETVASQNNTTEAKKLAQAVINKIIKSGMSDFDKAKAIHDYLVMNVDYDYENYIKNTIPAERYTAEGALRDKYAVCAGYAKAFKLLCELAGLECDYISGKVSRGYHAWNQVKVDEKWYNVDVTWDDPASTNKAFDDHKYNRYSYFLISDEIMYKDHMTTNAKHTCNSSLHTKAYEVGAPWATSSYAYVKSEEEIKVIVKKAIDANSANINLTWDTKWKNRTDMGDMVKGIMCEYVSMNCFRLDKYSYVTIPNTSLMSCTFIMELKNGSYEKINRLTTLDDIKTLILKLKNGNPDQDTVPMANELVKDDIFYKAAVWAWEEHDLSIGFSETEIQVSSTTKAVHVHAFKNDYHGDHYADEAYRVKSTTEILTIMDKYHSDPENGSFRIVYRYGDELGRLTADKLEAYIKKNLAPSWASNYCYESYRLETDDFICVTVIKFNYPAHSSEGMSWEYAKEPTCIESGISILKCGKCGTVIRSYEEEPTGKHTTYWVYDSETSRHLACKHCTYTGPVLEKYGEVWGYFDDTAAKETFTAVNVRRANECFREDDYMGNYIGTYYAPQLTWNEQLAGLVRTYAICVATSYINGEPVNSPDYTLYTFDANTPEQAAQALFSGVRPYYEILANPNLTQAGTSCFYYDSDGTGLKIKRVWCIYLTE